MKFIFNTNADTEHKIFRPDSLLDMHKFFIQTINNENYGFFHLTGNHAHIKKTQEVFEKFKDRKHFVQIGIGGSALGPQMLIDALGKNNGITFTWLDNTDAEYIHDELEKIDPKQSLFYVVSKSGGTAETMAAFAICRKLLNNAGVADSEFKKYFVFCTDPIKSDLRNLANEGGFEALEIPSNIGGRFSVLTAVGLFPALFAGININDLFIGAHEFKNKILSEDVDKNPLLQSAAHLAYLLFEEEIPVTQTILMPYSSKLKSFSHWFVQLWGESLGKFSSEKNINTGLTPIPAYGATDQHSQMQLFMEGPNDKFLFLVEVKNKRNNFDLDNTIGMDSATKLNGFKINQLIEAQLHGTISALRKRQRNLSHITIDKNDEKNLGAMIIFFESLTVLMGDYLCIDPFNQPGVELGKKYAFEYLKNSPQ